MITSGRLARIAAVAVGIWLMAAPAVLGYADQRAADVDRILGPVAGGLAFVAIWPFLRMVRWATVPVGIALVAAPLLGYPTDATVNSIACGLAIIGLAFVEGEPEGAFGGGWSVLWKGRRREPLQG
ncbi:MAG: hypothetical protein ACLGIC_12335 [Acidimicrobiia bacterium]